MIGVPGVSVTQLVGLHTNSAIGRAFLMVPKIVKEEVRNPSHAAHDPVQVSKRILFNFISSMTLD